MPRLVFEASAGVVSLSMAMKMAAPAQPAIRQVEGAASPLARVLVAELAALEGVESGPAIRTRPGG